MPIPSLLRSYSGTRSRFSRSNNVFGCFRLDLSIVSFHFPIDKSSHIYANSARANFIQFVNYFHENSWSVFFFFFFDLGRRLRILISDDDVRSGLEKFGIEGRDTERERKEKGRREWMDEGERWNHGERACATSSVREPTGH